MLGKYKIPKGNLWKC